MTHPTKKAISDLFANDGPLNDLVTHREGWRGALVSAKEKSLAEGDDATAHYYEHEIAVFDRTFAAVEQMAHNGSYEVPPLTSYDTLPCSVCETMVPPKSVTVSRSGRVSVAYQCSHCKTSWRIAHDGAQTHFRHGSDV